MTADSAASVVLLGLESVGKSALFRGLTGNAMGDETNFRGSTVVCRRCQLAECDCELVDTPGIRVEGDSAATALALQSLGGADAAVLVVRATRMAEETQLLLQASQLGGRRIAIAVTFADKVSTELAQAIEQLRQRVGVPVVALNARQVVGPMRQAVFDAIRAARPPTAPALEGPLVQLRTRPPARTLFEHRLWGPWLAVLGMAGLLGLPVLGAYQGAAWLQPWVEARLLEPCVQVLGGIWAPLAAILVGNYGVLTLGVYSFLWAFPVVLLLGVTSSIAEETGVYDRITSALDSWLRHVGLSGRDLVPVLTGFGCNVVAVLHTRACSACSRTSCVSLIAFGSACSYQIGASLSLFGAAGHSGLFVPYLLTVFGVGLVHTRVWHGSLAQHAVQPLHERAYLQPPSLPGVYWRLAVVLKQFLFQAMPIFLGLCLFSAALQYLGVLAWISAAVGPGLELFGLPSSPALAVLLSIPRKDGMLLLNAGNGELLDQLTAGQLLVVVYLASTIAPCLVTLAAVGRELGWKQAGKIAGRQVITSLVSCWLLSQLVI